MQPQKLLPSIGNVVTIPEKAVPNQINPKFRQSEIRDHKTISHIVQID